MHDHFGHFGSGKNYSLIKRYYFWPKMIKHIQKHVDSYSLCRREKMQADKYQLQTTEIPKRAFGKVSIDLIVDLPLSHNGNKNILGMVDQLTSWPIARAIPDKETTTIAKAVFEILFYNMVPQKFSYLTMVKNFPVILWLMSVRNMVLNSILLVPIHQGLMGKQRILINS